MSRDMGGALFKNDRKEKDTHPDYKGKATVDGKDYEIGAWLTESKNGTKYMSLKFSPPYVKEDQPEPAPQPQRQAPNSDIPF